MSEEPKEISQGDHLQHIEDRIALLTTAITDRRWGLFEKAVLSVLTLLCAWGAFITAGHYQRPTVKEVKSMIDEAPYPYLMDRKFIETTLTKLTVLVETNAKSIADLRVSVEGIRANGGQP